MPEVNWPIAFLLLGIIALFLFKQQIGRLIDRIRHIKAGKGVFEAETPITPHVEESKEEEVTEKEKLGEDFSEDEGPKDVSEWKKELFLAFVRKDKTALDYAIRQVRALNENLESQKELEVTYLQFCHQLGDTMAISNLKSFLEDSKLSFSANYALGRCYESSYDFRNAIVYFEEAIKKAKQENDKVLALSNLTNCLYQEGKKEEAIDLLSKFLREIQEIENKVSLYVALADVYEKEKDYESRAMLLDKAVELKPNDTTLLFKAGFSYSACDYDELSMLHYKSSVSVDPGDEGAMNNLGVQYDNLQMPIKSVNCYSEAKRLGSSLSGANLAYRFLNAGFFNEAKEVLESVKDLDDVHPNVGEAMAALKKREEAEEEKEEQTIVIARKIRKFFLDYVEAKLNLSDILPASGQWISDSGTLYEVKIDGGDISLKWKQKMLTFDREHKAQGKIVGSSAKLIFYEKRYNLTANGDEFEKFGRGFLLFGADKIEFLEIGKNKQDKKVHYLRKIV